MKKMWIWTFLLTIIFIGLASAQYYGTGISLSNFLYNNSSTLFVIIMFLIFFAVLHFLVFINVFRGRKGLSATLSGLISFGIVLGINRMGWDTDLLLRSLGLTTELLFTIFSILLVVAFIYALLKKKLRYLFLIVGAFLIVLSVFTEFFYEWGQMLLIGAILFVLGIFMILFNKRRGKRRPPYDHGPHSPSPFSARRGGYPPRRRRFKRTWEATSGARRKIKQAGHSALASRDPRYRLKRIREKEEEEKEREEARRQKKGLKEQRKKDRQIAKDIIRQKRGS